MNTPRLRSFTVRFAGSLAALLASFHSGSADAQPSARGAPVLRTPAVASAVPRAGAPAAPPPASAPSAAGSNAPGAGAKPPPGGSAAPDVGGASVDPLASLNKAPRDIDFKPKPSGSSVTLNFEDADLPEIVKAIGQATGRRFIFGGKLRQIKATVYSKEPVSVAEAYSVFLSILDTNGMTVIPHGRFLKIIETPGVVTQPTPIIGTASPVPLEDRFVTRLYRIANVDANDVATVLGKFKSKDGDITVYAPGNLLIITETGANIQRMMRIVEEVDVGSAGEMLFVEPVHYGQAAELATKLNEILDLKGKGAAAGAGAAGKPSAGPGGAKIVSDERTNSLIITATQGDYLRLLELIKRMDVPQSGEGEIHVLPLQHAGCKELSATLNQILGNATAAAGVGGVARPGGAAPAPAAAPAAGGARSASNLNAGITDDIFEGQIRVTCDEPTNSLVTTSSLRDYARIRPVIDRLDNPRRQVFIEAVIMDVNVDRSADLGLSYHAGMPVDFGSGKQGVFYGGENPSQSILGVPSNLEALALGLRGPEIEGSSNLFGTGVSIPALGVVMHALAKNGDSNVLATPHILATDNIPAEISIGQNIPLQTNVGGLGGLASLAGGAGAGAAAGLGALGGLGGLGGLGLGGFQAPRQDVGTKIKVVPHVNDSDQVRLELTEEISDAGSPIGAIGAIPINKRTASTTLIVRDQQTVVIGGLVRDAVTNGQTKVPVLGDIPVLGVLFRQSQHKNTKTNLLLVLTPYIIRDQEDLRAVFERKMQERQEFLDRYFVFNDNSSWEPPRDFSRVNGLVEDIRQSLFRRDDKARLEREAKRKGPPSHEVPASPIPLPSLGGRGGSSGARAEEGAGEVGLPAAVGAAPSARPKVRLPLVPSSKPGDRVE